MFGSQKRLREQHGLRILSVLFGLILCAYPSVAGTASAEDLPEDADRDLLIGDLGIFSLEGEFRLTQMPGEAPVFEFGSEPYILAVEPDGPSRGKLRPGDAIVAINGHLITTKQGGRLFGNPPAGEPVELTIRRGKRESTVMIVPVLISVDDPGALAGILKPDMWGLTIPLPGLPVPPLMNGDIRVEIPVVPTPDFDLRPGSLPPLGRLEFGLSCEHCSVRWDSDAGDYRWEFENPPEVYNLESDSPAYEAGLRRGDQLTHIDGIALDSKAGGARFSTLAPGDTVTWTARRWWKSREVTMTVEWPPEPEAAVPIPPPTPPETVEPEAGFEHLESDRYHLRYAGSVGSARIEVRSLDRVSVKTRQAGEGEEESVEKVVIMTGDTVIEIWKKSGE